MPVYIGLEEFLVNRIAAYDTGKAYNQSSYINFFKPMHSYEVYVNRIKVKKAFPANSNNKSHFDNQVNLLKRHFYLDSHGCTKFDALNVLECKYFFLKNRLYINYLSFGHRVAQCSFLSSSKYAKRHRDMSHINYKVILLFVHYPFTESSQPVLNSTLDTKNTIMQGQILQ